MSDNDLKTRILFVCLGNICRSPLAEALFLHKIRSRKIEHLFTVDSAGISNLHKGQKADPRTLANANNHGIEIVHRARQFQALDLQKFDKIVTMDQANRSKVLRHVSSNHDLLKVSLLLDHVPGMEGMAVPDPWYGGEEGFEEVFGIIDLGTEHFLASVLKKI